MSLAIRTSLLKYVGTAMYIRPTIDTTDLPFSLQWLAGLPTECDLSSQIESRLKNLECHLLLRVPQPGSCRSSSHLPALSAGHFPNVGWQQWWDHFYHFNTCLQGNKSKMELVINSVETATFKCPTPPPFITLATTFHLVGFCHLWLSELPDYQGLGGSAHNRSQR